MAASDELGKLFDTYNNLRERSVEIQKQSDAIKDIILEALGFHLLQEDD